ncbi:hypothetical protein BDV93DRAFT_565272 [Ceratobasidium sp. AG-I]|nr:hypothetical protein BDV93DRAFT_565272 [Ceratobasidium sp. AG-I]
MGSLQDWVTTTAGKTIENGAPAPVVYPDWSREGYPNLPNYIGLKLELAKNLLRSMIKAVARYQRWVGRMGWTEIAKDPAHFFDPMRLPRGLDTEFGDPSKFSQVDTASWLGFLLQCQTGQILPHKRFQFALVLAGAIPIHPSESQEVSRERGTDGGKPIWMLRFAETVTKCHQVGGMEYEQPALDYANFLSAGLAYANAVCAPPDNWLSLPVAGPTIPDSVMSGTEREGHLALASLLPESQANRIVGLLDALRDHQHHIPASDPNGVYASTNPPPKTIPPSPQSNHSTGTIWLGPSYFQPPHLAPPDGTVAYFEHWQESIKNVLVHESSGTLYGGETGVILVVRSLLHLYFTFAAVRGDFPLPEDPPAGYDLTRLPINEWPRLLQWIETWTLLLNGSTAILRKTSDEHRKGLGALQQLAEDEWNISQEPAETRRHETLAEAEPVHQPVTSKKKGHGGFKSKPQHQRRTSPASEDDASTTEGESEAEDEDIDCDGLDRTRQDDESDAGQDSDHGGRDINSIGCNGDGDVSMDLDRFGVRVTPGATGSTGSSDTGTPKSGVFGRFLELTPVLPISATTPHDIVKALDANDAICQQVLFEFDAYLKDNPRMPSLLVDNALAHSRDYPTHVQPLYQVLFLHKAAWKRAEAAAPIVFDHAQKVMLAFRDGIHLSLTAQGILERSAFPDSGLTALGFAKRLSKSKALLIELRWTFKELVAFHDLATKWHDMLGGWMGSSTPTDLNELVRVAQGLTDWTDEATALVSDLRSKRRSVWRKCCPAAPFDKRCGTSGMSFRFGSPSLSEEPEGLRDTLKIAKLALERGSTPTGWKTSAQDSAMKPSNTHDDASVSIATPTVGAVTDPIIPAAPVIALPSTGAAAATVICDPAAADIPAATTPSVRTAMATPAPDATTGLGPTPVATLVVAPVEAVPVPTPEISRQPSPIPIILSAATTSEKRASKRSRDEVEPATRRVSGRIAAANGEPLGSRTRSGVRSNTQAVIAKSASVKSTSTKCIDARSIGARKGGAKGAGAIAAGKGPVATRRGRR